MAHDEFILRAFEYLNRHLDPEIKKKLPPGVIREVLRCLSVWVLEKGFIEKVDAKGESAGLSYQEISNLIDEARERKRLKGEVVPD